uniref:Uncharacterized protein n=1 Tax=Glossina austeni TaxID=7395 RepID=A0A1A9UD32_GLOAU
MLISLLMYLLSTKDNNELKRKTRTEIFCTGSEEYGNNYPDSCPDNWELIKEVPKVRHKPNTQQHQIYGGFINPSINSVDELAVEKQNIEYKSNEIMVYYKDDLTNMDSSSNFLSNLGRKQIKNISGQDYSSCHRWWEKLARIQANVTRIKLAKTVLATLADDQKIAFALHRAFIAAITITVPLQCCLYSYNVARDKLIRTFSYICVVICILTNIRIRSLIAHSYSLVYFDYN